MWKCKATLLISTVVSLCGCAGLVSLHPLATSVDKDVVFEPALIGTWEEVSKTAGETPVKYVVERSGAGYTVTMTGGERATATMFLLKVRDRSLMDVYYAGDSPAVPVHMYVRLRLEKERAWIAEMESRWLKDQICGRSEIRHEVLAEDHGRVVLTGSKAELRRYLLPYVADDRSFGEESELRRVR